MKSPLLFFLSFILLACSTVQTNVDYNHNFDFSQLVSYKIIKKTRQLPDGSSVPSATYGLIKQAIDAQMASKGIGKNNDRADFGIAWHTALNDDVYSTGTSLPNWESSFSRTEEGMLIIDVFDLNTEELVWRGWEKDVLVSTNLEEQINEAVFNILSSFPPIR